MAIDTGSKPSDAPPDIEGALEELERKLERVKVLYEQYFMGIEKIEPQTARKQVARGLLELTQLNIRNTALRYRLNALNQKWGAYTAYWHRTLRAIESGTYFRNVAKVGRDALRRGVDIPDEVLHAMPVRMREKILRDRARIAAQTLRREKNQAPQAALEKSTSSELDFDEAFDQAFDNLTARAPHVRQPLPPGMDERAVKELFEKYVQAKELLGEDTRAVTYEQIANTVRAQGSRILAEHHAKGVEFEVEIRRDEVLLKAKPKR